MNRTAQGSMSETSTNGVCRLLWVLYSDANSRFNTLIEECAHLQDTIYGLTSSPTLTAQIIEETRAVDEVRGFERVVACDPKAHSKYYSATVRDRAFLSLWSTLGALICALDKNQRRHEKAYRQVVDAFNQSDARHGESDKLYWYISTRGYYLNTVFLHYTTQLEHAHEKLIQMLENQPGTLPNPILLRRWNSGLYGEFLSEYSRHVNWEAQTLIYRLQNPNFPPPQQQTLRRPSLTHTWAHYPTSLTNYFDINLMFEGDGRTEHSKRQRFATIRSAYFYLEQPVLLPLLYHECAHISFPEAPNYDHRDFFGARQTAIDSLRLAKFPPTPNFNSYENFWDHFTEELWADAISIALGGRSYVTALALQLFGLSGDSDFSHYRVDEDTLYELDILGQAQQRKYETPFPTLDLRFFWEARLLIACRLLQERNRRRGSSEANDEEISAAIDSLLLARWASGAKTFDKYGTSHKHATFWHYRQELNEWVTKVVLQNLLPVFGDACDRSSLCTTYQVRSAKARECIEGMVRAERHKYLPGAEVRTDLKLSAHQRLEDVAIDIRWAMAGDLIEAVRLEPNRTDSWVGVFSNWMCHDGGVPFRVALEASRLYLSLLDAAADMLSNLTSGATQGAAIGIAATPTWSRLRHEASPELVNLIRDDEPLRTALFRRRQITNSKDISYMPLAVELFNRAVEAIADDILECVASSMRQQCGGRINDQRAMPAGTLTLGAIRPEEFSVPGVHHQSAYFSGLLRAESYVGAAVAGQTKCANDPGAQGYLKNPVTFESCFVRLIGEYQFLGYVQGTTPVERDFHPVATDGAQPRMLVKPRMVLQVGGTPLAQGINSHPGHWARVALIRFKYRWQWYELRRQLEAAMASTSDGEKAELVDYSLLLSSAWEDVVLVTWHTDPASLWSLDRLNLVVGDDHGIDIQSAFIAPKACYELQVSSVAKPVPQGNEWIEGFKSWAATTDLVSRVYARSGRFDYTVVWKTVENEHILATATRGMAFMPSTLWGQISNMITSFEKLEWQPNGEKESSPVKAVTHFAVKNRLDQRSPV